MIRRLPASYLKIYPTGKMIRQDLEKEYSEREQGLNEREAELAEQAQG